MKNCLFEGIITGGGTMKKGEKALKYADVVWGKKVRRITLEDLCAN